MTKIKPPLRPLIISLIDIAKRNASITLLFHLFFVTVLQLLQTMLAKFTDFRRFHRNFALFNPFWAL